MKNNILSGAFFRRLFDSKRFCIIFSLVLAVIIWFVAVVNRNPERNQEFSNMPVNISTEGTVAQELGLGIVSDFSAQRFTVTVNGPNYIVSSLRAEDIQLSAAITEVNAAGKYNLTVAGSSVNNTSGYNIVSIEPSTVEVAFDYIDTKEFSVEAQSVSVSATDGLVAEAPVLSGADSNITIKGPRSVINRIDSVIALASVNKTLASTQTFDADVVLNDSDGKAIYTYTSEGRILNNDGKEIANNYLTLSNTIFKVTQPISKKATLKVKVAFSNIPSTFKTTDVSYSVDHETLTVIGTPEVVDKMTEVTLSAIDFRKVSNTDNSFEVSPVLPDGVKLMDKIDYFTVKINTSGYITKTFNITDIRFTDVASGLKAKSTSDVRNVKLCGPKNVINALTDAELYAEGSLSGKSAGEYTVNLTVKTKEDSIVWQVGEYTAAVTVK